MCMCVYVYVCLCACVSMCMCVYVYVCSSMSVPIGVCLFSMSFMSVPIGACLFFHAHMGTHVYCVPMFVSLFCEVGAYTCTCVFLCLPHTSTSHSLLAPTRALSSLFLTFSLTLSAPGRLRLRGCRVRTRRRGRGSRRDGAGKTASISAQHQRCQDPAPRAVWSRFVLYTRLFTTSRGYCSLLPVFTTSLKWTLN